MHSSHQDLSRSEVLVTLASTMLEEELKHFYLLREEMPEWRWPMQGKNLAFRLRLSSPKQQLLDLLDYLKKIMLKSLYMVPLGWRLTY